jgi:hypothetical protein
LGIFSPFGRLFSLGSFFLKQRKYVAQSFGMLYSTDQFLYKVCQKRSTFWVFFPQTHLVTLLKGRAVDAEEMQEFCPVL